MSLFVTENSLTIIISELLIIIARKMGCYLNIFYSLHVSKSTNGPFLFILRYSGILVFVYMIGGSQNKAIVKRCHLWSFKFHSIVFVCFPLMGSVILILALLKLKLQGLASNSPAGTSTPDSSPKRKRTRQVNSASSSQPSSPHPPSSAKRRR